MLTVVHLHFKLLLNLTVAKSEPFVQQNNYKTGILLFCLTAVKVYLTKYLAHLFEIFLSFYKTDCVIWDLTDSVGHLVIPLTDTEIHTAEYQQTTVY